jgi:hypothetical protein
MASPFAGFENTTLTFKVGGTATLDPITGNRSFARSNVVVEALLNEVSNQKQQDVQRPAGVDFQAIYLEGYAVIPSRLPATVRPNVWAEAEWAGFSGKFYVLLTASSPYGVEDSTGDRIRGWFMATA